MVDPQHQLTQRFAHAIAAALGDEHAGADPLIRPSQNPRFGDYQANAAMALGKKIGRNPREVAQAIVDALDIADLCEPPSIAGPGFINLKLTDEYLGRLATELACDERLGVERVEDPQTVVVDYSSPNVAKEMHVGHLRSTVIGDALARTLEFLGHTVIRQNHLGDWGTQFGMLIEFLFDTHSGAAAGDAHIADLNAFYQQAKQKFDADADFAERARRRVVALQSGDDTTLALWRKLVEESKAHFNGAYARLGVTLADADIAGESFYNDQLADVVRELREAGVAVESDGAICVFVDGVEAPQIVQKADGGYGYATTDLAAIRHRTVNLGADRIAYVVDARQQDHFKQLFWTARKMGWLDDHHVAEHVRFGTILGADGRPFKTRSGETVKLSDLLDEAIERAGRIVEQKNPDLDAAARQGVAQVVGIGAVKYGDLSADRVKDYKFEWDRMLAFEGNTAPYLQYAYVRVRSIFRKAETDAQTVRAKGGAIVVGHEAERALVLKLVQFASVLRSVAERLEPHHLCTWLYELATAYSRFFENCPVLRAESAALRDSRLRLCDLTSRGLRRGLGLLGIDVPERM